MLKLLNDIYKSSKRNWEIRRITDSQGFGRLSTLPLERLKRSDCLFILGSGASINQLSEDDFALIGRHDSVGFNFWLIHDFVPTYYLLELSPNEVRNDTFFELLEQRAHAYSGVPLIVQYKLWRRYQSGFDRVPGQLLSSIYLHAPWALLSPTERVLRMALTFWRLCGLGVGWRLEHLIHHRASLVLAVFFGLACGYRRLVLTGVDLKDSRYFWEEDSERWSGTPTPPNIQSGGIHATADPGLTDSLYTLPATEFLRLVQELVAEPLGAEIIVANSESLLRQHGFRHRNISDVGLDVDVPSSKSA